MQICVYCGSNLGGASGYQQAAGSLGAALARAGITLVYGGTTSGLMGILADAALAEGGRVIGVITHFLDEKGMAHHGLHELHKVKTMHQRKALMAKLADGYIAMPGGVGTLEEILEIWTWAQLGFHEKPCALFNVSGYYDKLLMFFDHMANEQFIRPQYRDMLLVGARPEQLLTIMQNYQAPANIPKWDIEYNGYNIDKPR